MIIVGADAPSQRIGLGPPVKRDSHAQHVAHLKLLTNLLKNLHFLRRLAY